MRQAITTGEQDGLLAGRSGAANTRPKGVRHPHRSAIDLTAKQATHTGAKAGHLQRKLGAVSIIHAHAKEVLLQAQVRTTRNMTVTQGEQIGSKAGVQRRRNGAVIISS